DVYGDWTGHYRAWTARPAGEALVVRFEELKAPSAEVLGRLAEVLGHHGPIRPWHDPQEDLRRHEPAFFGKGRATWQPGGLWTDAQLRVFFHLHGPLMRELGYATDEETRPPAREGGPTQDDLLGLVGCARGLLHDKRAGVRLLGEKEAQISELSRAITT